MPETVVKGEVLGVTSPARKGRGKSPSKSLALFFALFPAFLSTCLLVCLPALGFVCWFVGVFVYLPWGLSVFCVTVRETDSAGGTLGITEEFE
jgi:hypothetical protein